MCEANAYIIRDGEEELVMEAVDKIEPEDLTDGGSMTNRLSLQIF